MEQQPIRFSALHISQVLKTFHSHITRTCQHLDTWLARAHLSLTVANPNLPNVCKTFFERPMESTVLALGCSLVLLSCTDSPRRTPTAPIRSIPLCMGSRSFGVANWDSLPRPVLLEQIGNSHMDVGTRNRAAQAWFDQGLNLLHDFMYVDAYRAFREATRHDSTCAMAYWGQAMTLPGSVPEVLRLQEQALQKAQHFARNDREALYIQAARALASGGASAAIPAFRTLSHQYPNDPDAVALSAFMLRFGTNAEWAEGRVQAESGLRRWPTHSGLIHYYVHIMELSPAFGKALPYLPTLVRVAGGASHIVHMPGHLYFLQGHYEQAARAFAESDTLDLVHHKRTQIPFTDNDNYLHNLHYWALSLAEAGRRAEALDVAQRFADVHTTSIYQGGSGMLMVQYEGQVMPALVSMRFGEWQHAIDYLMAHPSTNPSARPFGEGLMAYCRAMEQLAQAHPASLPALQKNLAASIQSLESQIRPNGPKAGQDRINRALDILRVSEAELTGWIANLDPAGSLDQQAFFQALRLEKRIGYQEPPRLISPVFERIGDFFRQRHDYPNALQVYQKALAQRPHSAVIEAKIKAVQQQP